MSAAIFLFPVHFLLPVLCPLANCPDQFPDILDAVLKTLIEKQIGLECNTAGFKYGLGHPNPTEEILRRYRELGGELLTLGSDAHQPKHLAYDFARAGELLKTCGPSTGLFHEFEYKLAKKISDLVPSVEMFRMLGSGTEADMVAVRIARLKTGKKNILKMGGAYHGWSDQLAYGIRVPGTKGLLSKGVPGYVFKHTDEFFPNDLEDLERKLRANRLTGGTAAVFLEPMGPESGTRPLSREFVRGAAKLARDYGALLVFDEVVTGFRIGLSGAQGYFGVDPDLTVFGKIIAGGYPGAGGVGGHTDCMAHLGAGLDSSGKKVSKAMCGGTMAATPISCAAGYYALCEIERTNACEVAGRMGDRLTRGLQDLIKKYGLPFVAFNQGSICHLDSVGTMHFSIDWSKPWTIPHILKETGVRQKEMEHMGAAYMAEGIVTLAGSRLYTSAAYTEEMIDDVLSRFDRVLANCGPIGG